MERSAEFYTALGWKRVPTNEKIVVYDLIGQTLGLYPKAKLCEDIGIPVGEAASGNGFSGITMGYNVREKKEVDEVLDKVDKAGGRILKKASDAFWGGYHGYFADFDGHIWEVAFNPYSPLHADGAFRWKGYKE